MCFTLPQRIKLRTALNLICAVLLFSATFLPLRSLAANADPVVECDNQNQTCSLKNLSVLDRRNPDKTQYAAMYCVAQDGTKFVMMRNHCSLMKGFSYFASGMTGYILFHNDFTADDNNYADAFHQLSEFNAVYFQAVEDNTKYGKTCDDSRIDFISEPKGSVQCFPGKGENRQPLKGMFG